MNLTIKEINTKKLFLNALGTPDDKLSFYVRKLTQHITSALQIHVDTLNEKLEEIAILHAMVGESGELLLKGDRYQFTKESMIALNKERRKVLREFEAIVVDVLPAIIPAKLYPARVSALDPILKAELKGLLF